MRSKKLVHFDNGPRIRRARMPHDDVDDLLDELDDLLNDSPPGPSSTPSYQPRQPQPAAQQPAPLSTPTPPPPSMHGTAGNPTTEQLAASVRRMSEELVDQLRRTAPAQPAAPQAATPPWWAMAPPWAQQQPGRGPPVNRGPRWQRPSGSYENAAIKFTYQDTADKILASDSHWKCVKCGTPNWANKATPQVFCAACMDQCP